MRLTRQNRTLSVLSLCVAAALLWVAYRNSLPAETAQDPLEAEVRVAAGPRLVEDELLAPPAADRELPAVDSSPSTESPEPVAEPPDSIQFLPYPNDGEPDFARKYDDLTAEELYERLKPLNLLMSEQVWNHGARMFETGAFVSRDESQTHITSEEQMTHEYCFYDEPKGLGRVWPVSQGISLGGGHHEIQIAYVTEVEHPEVFAMQDEYKYAFRAWKRKSEGMVYAK